jgi:hypothetical protein
MKWPNIGQITLVCTRSPAAWPLCLHVHSAGPMLPLNPPLLVQINVDGDIVTISVSTSQESATTTSPAAVDGNTDTAIEQSDVSAPTFHRRERSTTFWGRTIHMPESANMDEIGAQLAEGVLTVSIPKRAEHAAPKRRQIRIA